MIDALNNLNPNKARGIDNIAPVILKNCAFTLALPIHHLFTTSLRSGNIPSEWKTHKIIPVFKSGDKTSVANYRPISLLCVISKVLERLVYDKVIGTIAPSITLHQFGSQLQHDDFIRALKRISNWKSPGLDSFVDFGLKVLLTSRCIFTSFKSIVVRIIPTLVVRKTVLIVKNPSKGNIPSNYRPITCLSTVWKFLTSVLRLVLHRHLVSVSAIPFQQKGCTHSSKGSKDHLIVDTFIMNDARRRHKNLYMGWLDVKKPLTLFHMTGYYIV